MSAIYLHIPFCKRMCGYCDFFKSAKLQELPRVIDAMEREIADERGFLEGEPLRTIYFGGGTPSLVHPDDLARLLDHIAAHYDVSGVSEITLEANPDDLSLEYLQSLRSAGINRLSIGIQSFDDRELKFMNRRHSSQQAVEAVAMARQAGFENITIDLIFGVDGFGEHILRGSIAQALALDVQHISAYHLTLESGTPFGRKAARGALKAVSQEQSDLEYHIVDELLTAAGFEHYEVSNYAKPGFRSRHNSSYWQGVKYLGIGAGAHSYNGRVRRWAVESVVGYLAGGVARYEHENLTPCDHYNEFIMTSLRCCEGVDLAILEQRFEKKYVDFFLSNVKRWLQEGKLSVKNGRIFIPANHFLISDLIIESLFYC
ncbi:MAG: radical SAM family heme chaperone HemW [Rikenellaceae bacterium]